MSAMTLATVMLVQPVPLPPEAALPAPEFGPDTAPTESETEPRAHTARRALPRVLKEEGKRSAFDGDFLIIAAGPVWLPRYEGSNSNSVVAGAAIAGRIKGIGISPRAAGLALDFVPDKTGARVTFGLGPVFRLRSNRTGQIKDPVVEKLGKLGGVVEGGVAASATVKRVLNPHDQLSFGLDLRWDLSGKGSGRIAAASVSYFTPISKAQVIGINASAEFADRRFARYNYSISAAGSAASGLPAFQARGGLKSLSIGALTGRDFNGNLLDGGFAVGAGMMYQRLMGGAAATPITRQRGSRNQWIAAAGISYTF